MLPAGKVSERPSWHGVWFRWGSGPTRVHQRPRSYGRPAAANLSNLSGPASFSPPVHHRTASRPDARHSRLGRRAASASAVPGEAPALECLRVRACLLSVPGQQWALLHVSKYIPCTQKGPIRTVTPRTNSTRGVLHRDAAHCVWHARSACRAPSGTDLL